MSEWKTVRLGEVADSISTTHERKKEKLVFLNTSDVLFGKFLHQTYTEVSGWPGQAKKSICRDDILLSEIRPANGRWAYVNFDADDFVVSTKLMVIRAHSNRIFPRFLYHFLTSLQTISWLQHLAESRSGTFPQITFDQVAELEISLPPPADQRAIAGFLDCISDKIELNRKQNETLEAMARALFKAWFVDFEPVRAKMEGRWVRGQSLPGLPAHLFDLFPDKLVESELGEIPDGWELTPLSEFSSLNPESWTKRTRPEVILYVDISNTKWGRIESVTKYEADDAPSRAQRVLRPQDTIIGTVRPGNGSYALISDENLTGSTGFAVLRPLRREYSEFVYLAATAPENIERLSNLADGGAYPAVRPEIVSATQVPYTCKELINEFSRQVNSMLAGIADNECTSRSLAQLRDTLLPKLISGELRVPSVMIEGII